MTDEQSLQHIVEEETGKPITQSIRELWQSTFEAPEYTPSGKTHEWARYSQEQKDK